jgi:hypothetical protein
MRLLILLDKDTTARKQEVENALLKIKDDYATGNVPVTWEYELRDFSQLTWVEYLPQSLGISYDIVNKDIAAIYLRDGEKWDQHHLRCRSFALEGGRDRRMESWRAAQGLYHSGNHRLPEPVMAVQDFRDGNRP